MYAWNPGNKALLLIGGDGLGLGHLSSTTPESVSMANKFCQTRPEQASDNGNLLKNVLGDYRTAEKLADKNEYLRLLVPG